MRPGRVTARPRRARYYLDEKWTAKKFDCEVPMPETLDLEAWRGTAGLLRAREGRARSQAGEAVRHHLVANTVTEYCEWHSYRYLACPLPAHLGKALTLR